MTTREMELASEGDQELWTIWECLVNGQWHRIAYKEYFPMRNEVCAISKLVLRGTRIVVPTILREHVLELAHEGHPGIMYIHTDNGRQFTSQHFKDFMLENGITHHRTTPLWSQANGEEERQNRSIMKRVRIAQAEGRDWRSELDKFLIMYSTVHTIMGVSPSELLFGRKIRTKLPELTTMSMT
jgi:transposase InsO family protein